VKIGIYSDLHLTNDSVYKLDMDHLEKVYKKFYEDGVSYIFFLGDLFTKKHVVSDFLLTETSKFFKRHSQVPTYFLVGNHDKGRMNEEGNYAFTTSFLNLGKNFKVIDKPDTVTVGRKTIYMVPWFKQGSDIKFKDADILMIHEYIEGTFDLCSTKVNFNKSNTTDLVSMKDISKYPIVFDGHIHAPIDIDNVHIVGATFPNNFGEICKTYSFIIYDTDTNVLKRYSIKGYRKYITKYITSEIPHSILNDKYNFYRIIYSGKRPNVTNPNIILIPETNKGDIIDLSTSNELDSKKILIQKFKEFTKNKQAIREFKKFIKNINK